MSYVNYIKLLNEVANVYGAYSKTFITLSEIIDKCVSADVVEAKQIEIIRDDLKWWLETNSEKGVVHIPKYVVENMIAKMDGERRDA